MARVAMLVMNPCVSDSRVRNEAAALANLGHDVLVLALADFATPPGLVEEPAGYRIQRVAVARQADRGRRAIRASQSDGGVGLRHRTLSISRRLLLPLYQWWQRTQFGRLAYQHLVGWKPDAVHANDLETLSAASRVAGRVGASVVYDSHELWLHRTTARRFRLQHIADNWTERRLIKEAALVATVSPGIAEWLAHRYDIAKPLLLRNAPTEAALRDVPGLRTRSGLTDSDTLIVYTGGVIRHRGVELAIDALAALSDNHHFVMLGSIHPTYAAELRERAAVRHVASRIHFLDAVGPDEVVSTIADADVAVVLTEPVNLSHQLSLPNKLFQAVQAGIPVATCADLVEVQRLVEEYGIGVAAARSAEALAQAILAIGTSDFSPGLIAAAGELTWSKESAAFLRAYEALLAGRAP